MYLRRLQLRGFKTFVQPTDLEFDAGVTAIVGPNGSGKSNLVDALRWVLGEQSMRLLRSRKTEDVIFAGSSQRARVGMAEVSLTLDNEAGWIDLPYSEVTVTRRAHRSGENECLLNGSRVRLRDVNDLLTRAHATQTGYTVIGQGLVDSVLTWRPEERRALIDETAQLRLPQAQLQEARQKLGQANDDLVRLEAKVAELQPRLEHAAKKAAQAERYATLSEELLVLQRRHYGDLWATANRALAEAGERRRRAAEAVAGVEAEMAQAQARTAQARTLQTELQSRAAGLRNRRAELERSRERWRRQMAVARQRQEMLARQRQQLAGEIESMAARLADTHTQIEDTEARLKDVQAERDEAYGELRQAEAGQQALAQAERQKQAELQALRARIGGLTRRLSELKEQRLRLEHRRDTLAGSLAGRRRSLADAEARLAGQAERVERLKARRQDQAEAAEAARQRLDEEERDLAAGQGEGEGLRREREGLSVEMARLRAQWEQVTQRSDSLLQMLRPDKAAPQAKDASQGSQKDARPGALGGNGQNGPRILGTVEQLTAAGHLQVQPRMERAIAAALQGFRFNVVVEDWEEARRVLGLVAQKPTGEVWVLPRQLAEAGDTPSITDEGFLGAASGWAVPSGPHAGLVRAILSHSLIVVDMEAALRLLPQCPPQFQMVTIAGEVLQPWGRASTIPGGQPALPTDDVRSRLESLPGRIAEVDARLRALQQAASQRQARVREAQARLHEAQTALRLTDADVANAEAALRRAVGELPRMRQGVTRDEKEMEEVTGQEMAAARTVAELGPQLQEEEARLTPLEEALRALTTERASASSELRHRHELLEREERSLRTILDNHRRRAADLSRESSQRQARHRALEQEDRGAAGEIETATAQTQTISAELKQLLTEIGDVEARLKTETETIEALLSQERTRYRAQAQAEASLREATAAEERARKEAATLEKQIRAELGSLDDLRPGEADETLPGRLRQVQEELHRLGAPDAGAIEEHTGLQGEDERLRASLADLRESVQGLSELVARLEGALNERFKATFNAVQAEFQRFFRAILGGGHANLELITSEEGNATGLDIIAQPPGKRLQSLASLSGGERALTSIAFFFAMLQVHPPPFCVLDEVDAALDDANTGRFAGLLQRLSDRTQFLVITHNRVTMEAAGTLYGVTMADTGTSQIVSLRLEEAQAHAGRE